MQTSPEVSSKRKALIRDIRNLSTEGLKKRARSQVLTLRSNQDLAFLIDNTQNKLSEQELDLLVGYANQQFPKAIAHLGNLLLDGTLKINQLEKRQLKVGYHPYWLWLIEVMVEKEYCTLSLLQHCIKSVSPLRSQATVVRSLSILYKISSSNLHSPLFFRDEKTLLNIINASMRSDEASDYGFLLIHQLVKRSNEEIKQRFDDGPLRVKFLQALMQGSLKIEARPQLLTCKILKELIERGVYFSQLNQTVLQLMKQSTQSQVKQILMDYLGHLITRGRIDDITAMLDIGLIGYLSDMKKDFQEEENEYAQYSIITIGRQLYQRTAEMGHLQRGVLRQLQRYNLLDFSKRFEQC